MISQKRYGVENNHRLFSKGVTAFNQRRFLEAHEYWEDLWIHYKLADADLIQGLIQLSVAYFHILNLNLPGARSLFAKCLPKLKTGMGTGRLTNLEEMIALIQRASAHLAEITETTDFNWNYLMELNQNDQ